MKIINKKNLNAFLAMPVTDSWDSNRVFRVERQKFFKSIIQCLKKEGYEVSNAGTNENWGKKRVTIKQFTKYDVDSIEKCDLFVLVTCERITSDMYLEIGIALTRNRPILLIIPASARVTHMLLGLNMMKHIFIRTYDSEPHALVLLKNFLSNLRLNIMKYCAVEEKIDQRPGLANQDLNNKYFNHKKDNCKMDGIILAKLHTDTNAFYTHLKTSLSNNNWKRLDVAIAFARNDGIELIIDQLSALSRSIPIRIVVGIDFKMTTYEALHSFLTKLDTKSEIWIFNDQSEACFHPKIYLFTGGKVAKLFIGSANLTRSGIIKNHEAMLEIDVDLARQDGLTFYNEVYFRIENWAKPHNKHSQRLTNKYLEILLSNGYVMRESEVLMKRQKESKTKYEK